MRDGTAEALSDGRESSIQTLRSLPRRVPAKGVQGSQSVTSGQSDAFNETRHSTDTSEAIRE